MCTNKGQIGVPRQREEECKPEMGSSWNSCQKNEQMFQYFSRFTYTHLKRKLIYFEILYPEWFWGWGGMGEKARQYCLIQTNVRNIKLEICIVMHLYWFHICKSMCLVTSVLEGMKYLF